MVKIEHIIMNIIGTLILIHVGVAANNIHVNGESKFEIICNSAIVIIILCAAALTGFLFIKV